SYNRGEARYVNFPSWWWGENRWDYWAALPNAWDFLDDGVFTPPDLAPNGQYFGEHHKQSGVYAALRLKATDHIAAVLGLRVSDWKLSAWNDFSGEVSTTTLTDENNVLTPYAGVLVDLTENLTAYASYTDIFEPQSAEDPEGHRLDPLVGSTYEIGLKREFREGRLYAAVSAFRTEQDNLAVPIPDAPPNPNGNYPSTAEDGTVSQGYELEVVGELSPGWQIGGGYAYAKVEDAEGMALLTQVPKDTLKVFSTYQLTGALQGLRIGGNVRWQGKTFSNDGLTGEDFVQGSQFSIDLMAYYKVTEQVSLSLHVNNVTDEVYYSGIGWLSGFYETPRNFLFGFRWAL
ncbi:MAG TPA: TonB-dependent receptor, partial [Burkholderiales bacterium]|nr:TonB-dependent receptor [Burkholderiales bacterium]